MRRCGSASHRLTRDYTGGQPCAAAEVILSRPNAFRKFAEVTNLLYYLREIGTYTGDVDSRLPARLPGGVGAPDRLARRADAGHAAREEAARAAQPGAACVDLSRDARRRHVGRASLPVVPHAPGRQFVVGSSAAAAVGDLCRADAARAAAP